MNRILSTLFAALMALTVTAQVVERHPRGRIEHVGQNYISSSASSDGTEGALRRVGLRSTAPLPCTGSPHVPVILVQFSDMEFTVAETKQQIQTLYDGFFNAAAGVHPGQANSTSYCSVREYYRLQSGGAFTPVFEVFGPVTLSKGYAYYGANKGSTQDYRIREFYSEACKLVAQEGISLDAFDNNDDDVIDFVFFIYAGEGENGCDDVNTIWPKEGTASLTVSYDGNDICFGSYGCANELYDGLQDGIGCAIHELAHGLGLADHYDTRGTCYGMDYWDIMDAGCYQLDGHIPCTMTAYEKDFMGWKNLVTLATDESYHLTLYPMEEDGTAYKVVNAANANEYLILENRQSIGLDEYMGLPFIDLLSSYQKNHGLMVTHIDYSVSSWTQNIINAYSSRQRMTIVPADGTLISSSDGKTVGWMKSLHDDLYPGDANVTTLTSHAAFTGGTFGQRVHNIVENADGTITLDVTPADQLTDIATPTATQPDNGNTIYTAAGQHVSTLQRGINIVRTPNGTIQKIFVR